jgi:hypothetical protein
MIGKINEDFKHIIHVDTPTQVVSKPVAAQILALAKKGIRSKDIGLEMGFVGNAKLATDAFQKVKNKIYFQLGNKNESVNEAFNIKHLPTWLFDDPVDFMEWYEDDMELKVGRMPPFNKADELTLLRLVKAWMEAEDDYRDGRGDLGTGKQGAARAASYKAQDAIKQFLNKKSKVANESVNEVATRTAMEIGGLTGMNKDAIQKFVDEHNLDIEKVFEFVKKGKLPARMDFMTAVVGKPGNPIQKKIIKMFSESVTEGSHGMATKILQSVVNGDSSRAEGTKMSKELAQHYIDWIRTSPFGKKNGNLPLDMLVKASFNWGIERGLDSKLKGELSKLKSTIKDSVNESLIAKDGKILLNGKPVGYYDYDRDSAAFWTTDLSDKQFRGSQAFDTKEEMLAFFKKYLSRAAKALEYQRKALSKFGIKYPADESVNEVAFKSPDYIVTSISADAIPPTNISKADVGLGLSMFDTLGRGWTLNNKDYKLDYHNGKVALVLTKQGKLAVRVKSGHDPKYVEKIEKFVNDYLAKFAKNIKKTESVNEEHDCGCNENHDCGCGGVHEHHIHEDINADANGIAGLTASRANAVKDFIEKNNINSNKLYLSLKKGGLKDRMDFVTALVGKPGNPIQKKVIAQFSN